MATPPGPFLATPATPVASIIPPPRLQPLRDLPQAPRVARTLADQVAEVERAAIAQALRDSGGNRAQTARQLGMSRAALYDRLARWPDLHRAL
jgi:DNA-binding NtrC family response regulator